MLAIKLKRIGKKHQASYRMVVAEKRSKTTGAFVEDLGFYNPHSKDIKVNGERVKYWMDNGAEPTDSVFNLLLKAKAVEGNRRMNHVTRKRKKQLEREAMAKAKAEAPVSEEAPAEQAKGEE